MSVLCLSVTDAENAGEENVGHVGGAGGGGCGAEGKKEGGREGGGALCPPALSSPPAPCPLPPSLSLSRVPAIAVASCGAEFSQHLNWVCESDFLSLSPILLCCNLGCMHYAIITGCITEK